MSAATTPRKESGPQVLEHLRAGENKRKDAMNSTPIVQQATDGELFTTSEAIADGSGVEHRAVLQMIEKYSSKIEERFGPLAFEMRKGAALPHGGFAKGTRVAKLNEQQASFVLTLARNTDQVVNFKADLVAEFDRMAKQIAGQQQAITPEEQMAQGLIAAQRMLDEKARELEEVKPKAEFADTFLSANGDYDTRDAAQILRRDHGITDIGQNRLRDWMERHGWIDAKRRPYQHKIDAGHLRLKPSSFRFKRTNGDVQLADPQLRVTPKGVEALARSMKAGQTMEAA